MAPVGGMWVGNFHGLAHRFPRAHWQDAGLPQHFQITDSDDQLQLVKRVLKAISSQGQEHPQPLQRSARRGKTATSRRFRCPLGALPGDAGGHPQGAADRGSRFEQWIGHGPRFRNAPRFKRLIAGPTPTLSLHAVTVINLAS